jgi:CCR4-NOT transcription complex subunit 2
LLLLCFSVSCRLPSQYLPAASAPLFGRRLIILTMEYDREFPSLSNASQPNASQSSMWSSAGARNVGTPTLGQRSQNTPLSAQTSQGDDLFSSGARLQSNQGSFRFGNQGSIGQPSQAQSGSADEFPPLNRNANGEIGPERGSSGPMSGLGFGSQTTASSSSQSGRVSNGLLNALSANARAAEVRSPGGSLSP